MFEEKQPRAMRLREGCDLRAKRLCSFNKGGGGGNTTTQEFKPPDYTKEGWQSYLDSAQTLSQRPYQQSGLPQVAPINDYQNSAMQLAYNRAMYGAPDINAARGSAMNAAQGNYANPYTSNVAGIASGAAYNPWSEGTYNLAGQAANPYASDEYTQQMIANNAGQMAKAYSVGGAAQNDAAAAMQGAYGGSAYQEMKDRGEASLAGQIGNMATQVQQQERQYQGNMYNQSFQNQLAALGLGSQQYMGDVANQLNANQMAMGGWNSDINNILSGAGLAGQLSQDDYKSTEGLMQAGNVWNSYYQRLLDQYNNQWNTENMYDATQNEYLGSALGRASGSYGTTAVQTPGQNTLAGLLGLGAAGAGMYSLYK